MVVEQASKARWTSDLPPAATTSAGVKAETAWSARGARTRTSLETMLRGVCGWRAWKWSRASGGESRGGGREVSGDQEYEPG